MAWTRFTGRIREAIVLGQEEAVKMGCSYVSTEHLLLGLMQVDGLGSRVLEGMSVSLNEVRREIVNEYGPSSKSVAGNTAGVALQLTPALEQIYKLAADESQQMNLDYIGTEQLLLALLREEDSLASKILRRQGVGLESARNRVRQELQPGGDNENGQA